MKKEEVIRRFGKEEFKRRLQLTKAWNEKHPERVKELHEGYKKGGKYYQHHLKYQTTGLQSKRNAVRNRHWHHFYKYKMIIAPESQIHHEWIQGTADYRGVALVETNQHQHGFIDVIEIIEEKITLFTETEIRGIRNEIR